MCSLSESTREWERAWTAMPCSCVIKISFNRPPRYWIGGMLRKSIARELRMRCPYPRCGACGEAMTRCPYHYFFRSGTRPLLLGVPPPWYVSKGIIRGEDNGWWLNGKVMELRVTLFGRVFLPYLLSALAAVGKRGLMGGKIKFEIREIRDHEGNHVSYESLYSPPALLDPWKVKPTLYKTIAYIQYTPHSLFLPVSLEVLLESIRQRFIRLVNAYGFEKEVEKVNVKATIKRYSTKAVRLYAYRRGEKTFFNASIGEIVYSIEKISPWSARLLSLAPIIGGGKNITFGFGFAKIREVFP